MDVAFAEGGAGDFHEDGVLAEIAKYGRVTVKRIYGDWATQNLTGWRNVLAEHSITPIQQPRYTIGKNATDTAMVIDAMDLLYGGRIEGFGIVSSDSDFTRLASRLRESGQVVYGFGERKTPKPFVAACDKFVYTEILRGPLEPAHKPDGDAALEALWSILAPAITASTREDGWAPLSNVGHHAAKAHPSFDRATTDSRS